jgi:hypothetical protein
MSRPILVTGPNRLHASVSSSDVAEVGTEPGGPLMAIAFMGHNAYSPSQRGESKLACFLLPTAIFQ